MNKIRKHNTTVELAKELVGDFINLFFGNIWTKVGLSLLLFVLGLVFILSPLADQDEKPLTKPTSFYIIGSTLIIISVGLIVKRWTELKEKVIADIFNRYPKCHSFLKDIFLDK